MLNIWVREAGQRGPGEHQGIIVIRPSSSLFQGIGRRIDDKRRGTQLPAAANTRCPHGERAKSMTKK
jgi:hypothetical protein